VPFQQSATAFGSIVPYSFENKPMGDELKWLLKEGSGRIFESCYIYIFLMKIRPPRTQSNLIYVWEKVSSSQFMLRLCHLIKYCKNPSHVHTC